MERVNVYTAVIVCAVAIYRVMASTTSTASSNISREEDEVLEQLLIVIRHGESSVVGKAVALSLDEINRH